MSLYVGLNGEIACTQHMGTYAQVELKQNPNAKTIKTPINVWSYMNHLEELDFAEFLVKVGKGGLPICESCRHAMEVTK